MLYVPEPGNRRRHSDTDIDFIADCRVWHVKLTSNVCFPASCRRSFSLVQLSENYLRVIEVNIIRGLYIFHCLFNTHFAENSNIHFNTIQIANVVQKQVTEDDNWRRSLHKNQHLQSPIRPR